MDEVLGAGEVFGELANPEDNPTPDRVWIQYTPEEKVELLRQVVQALVRDFEDHQHANGIVVVPPEGLRGLLD